MNALISTEQLSDWSQCKQRSRLIRWLNDNRIPYRLNAKGEPVTTLDAVNASLLEQNGNEVDF